MAFQINLKCASSFFTVERYSSLDFPETERCSIGDFAPGCDGQGVLGYLS